MSQDRVAPRQRGTMTSPDRRQRPPAVRERLPAATTLPTPDSTRPITLTGVAPSAMRTPSSRVRCCTEYASTPNTPTIASSNASDPNVPTRTARNTIPFRRCAGDVLECHDVVRCLTWINISNRRTHGRGDCTRVAVGHTDNEECIGPGVLIERSVQLSELLEFIRATLSPGGRRRQSLARRRR